MTKLTVADVRAKFPQYEDLSDDQLLEGVRRKFYADIPREKFFADFGLTAAPSPSADRAPPRAPRAPVVDTTAPAAPQMPATPEAEIAALMAPAAPEAAPRLSPTPPMPTPSAPSMIMPDTATGPTRLAEVPPPARPPAMPLEAAPKADTRFTPRATLAPADDPLIAAMTAPQPAPAATSSRDLTGSRAPSDPFEDEGFGALAARRGQQFAQGATDVVAAVPESVAITGEMADRSRAAGAGGALDQRAQIIADIEATLADPNLDPEDRALLERNLADLTEGQGVIQGMKDAPIVPAQDRPIYGAGEKIRTAVSDVVGAPDPRDRSFWGQVATGAGNMTGMIAAATAGTVVGGPIAGAAIGAGTGAAMNQSQVFEEALQGGADQETALQAAKWATLIGASEIIPITRALKLLPPRLRGELTTGMMRKFVDIAQASGEEAAQEYLATVANNIVAQQLYDADRGWTEGATEAAMVGAVLGAGVGTAGVALEGRGDAAPPATVPPRPPAQPQTPEEELAAVMGAPAPQAAPAAPSAPAQPAQPQAEAAPVVPEAPPEAEIAAAMGAEPAPAPQQADPTEGGRFEILDEIENTPGGQIATGRKIRVDLETGQATVVGADGTPAQAGGAPGADSGTGQQPQAEDAPVMGAGDVPPAAARTPDEELAAAMGAEAQPAAPQAPEAPAPADGFDVEARAARFPTTLEDIATPPQKGERGRQTHIYGEIDGKRYYLASVTGNADSAAQEWAKTYPQARILTTDRADGTSINGEVPELDAALAARGGAQAAPEEEIAAAMGAQPAPAADPLQRDGYTARTEVTRPLVEAGGEFWQIASGAYGKLRRTTDNNGKTRLEFTLYDAKTGKAIPTSRPTFDVWAKDGKLFTQEGFGGRNEWREIKPVTKAVATAPFGASAPQAPAGINFQSIRTDKARTPAGTEIDVEYAIVDLDDLTASNLPDGRINPAYPQERQPRDRTKGQSEQQIQRIMRDFDPRQLDAAPTTDTGAMIVDENGIVESGNGRTMTLQRIYQDRPDLARAYVAHLEAQGYPVDGIARPVLVRIRRTEMTPEEIEGYTRESNTDTKLAMSATEQAMSDAAALPDSALDLYRGGDIDTAGNRDFVRAFIQAVVTENEQGKMIAPDGSMSQDAVRRVQGALLAKAYGDPALVAKLIESADNNIKSIGGALLDVSASWAKMRAAARAQTIAPEMDQTEALIEAVRLVDRARTEKRNVIEYVKQPDLLSGDGISPMGQRFLALMFKDTRQWTRPAGRDNLARWLGYYVEEAMKSAPGADLFGAAANPGGTLDLAKEKQDGDEKGSGGQQTDLFAPRPAGSDGQSVRPADGGGDGPGAQGAAAQDGGQRPAGQPEGLKPATAKPTPITDELQRAIEARARFVQPGEGLIPPGHYDYLTDATSSLWPALAKAKTDEDRRTAAVDWVTEQAREKNVEYLVMFDTDGAVIAALRGTKNAIDFPPHVQRAKEAGAVGYTVHNHPSNRGPSLPDLKTLVTGAPNMEIVGTLQKGPFGKLPGRHMLNPGPVLTAESGKDQIEAMHKAAVARLTALGNARMETRKAQLLANPLPRTETATSVELANDQLTTLNEALNFTFDHIITLALARMGVLDYEGNADAIVRAAGVDPDEFFDDLFDAVQPVAGRFGLQLTRGGDRGGDQAPGSAAGAAGTGGSAGGTDRGTAGDAGTGDRKGRPDQGTADLEARAEAIEDWLKANGFEKGSSIPAMDARRGYDWAIKAWEARIEVLKAARAAGGYPEPNENFVYSKDDAKPGDVMTLPAAKRGNMAEIELLEVAPGQWVQATGYEISEAGGGGPLMVGRDGAYPSRDAALSAAVADLRRTMEKAAGNRGNSATQLANARKVLGWLDTLSPRPSTPSDTPPKTRAPKSGKPSSGNADLDAALDDIFGDDDDAPGTGGDLERDSGDAGSSDGMGGTDVPPAAGGSGPGAGKRGGKGGGTGGKRGGRRSIPGGDAAPVGGAGNQGVDAGGGTKRGPAAGGDGGRGAGAGQGGLSPDAGRGANPAGTAAGGTRVTLTDAERAAAIRDILKENLERMIDRPGFAEGRGAGVDVPDFAKPQAGWGDTTTPAFRRWFGDSKVVDENGNPKILYHGTARQNWKDDFNTFATMAWGAEEMRLAFDYMKARESMLRGNGVGRLIQMYARIERPFNADLGLPRAVTIGDMLNALVEQAQDQGRTLSDAQTARMRELSDILDRARRREESGPHYSRHDFWHTPRDLFGADGAAALEEAFEITGFDGITMIEDGVKTWGAFKPTQVKDLFNRGTFDPDDGNMLAEGDGLDPRKYEALEALFIDGMRAAGADPDKMSDRDMFRAIATPLKNAGLDRETIVKMAPYLEAFTRNVKSGRVKLDPEPDPQPAPDDKAEAQRKADRIKPVMADEANIRATLPTLLPEQQDDVVKIETRFAKPDGHGMLITNGTGTGKTFTGGGQIKRFVQMGKGEILIVAPSEAVIAGWKRALEALGVPVSQLRDTRDAGQGVVITTYANLEQNQALATRSFDLVVADESQNLMSNKDGNPTGALQNLRAITHRPADLWRKHVMIHADEYARLKKMRDGEAKTQEFARLRKIQEREVEAWSKEPRSKVLFLSATPFAYDKTVDYVEGYLFDYPKDGHVGHSRQDGRALFMIQNFGYRIRYHKLTKPESAVDSAVFEREFHEKLKREGVLSGRSLQIDVDYDRKFVTVADAIGTKIDAVLKSLSEGASSKDKALADGYRTIRDQVMKKFNYLKRMQLLEAIKAKAAVDDIKAHLALGRKVVVFHDYNVGGGFNPFGGIAVLDDANAIAALADLMQQHPDLNDLDFSAYDAPADTLKAAFGKQAAVFSGLVPQKQRLEGLARFNTDDSGTDILIVQSDAGGAGISMHDLTGTHQRALINLGMPTKPTTTLQEEGRILRVGTVTDAIFRYYTIGTAWERAAFAQRIAERSGTVENLALGNEARMLRDAFIDAYVEAEPRTPSAEDGKGGKAKDGAAVKASPYEIAKTHYFGKMKVKGRRDQREGIDFYSTPEPLGFKMVEWAGARPNERVLEPSAGDGAIARYFPENVAITMVEPSNDLGTRAQLRAPTATLQTSTFEDYHIVNKHHVIVMNPPFGSGGATAVAHLAKAARHLRDGGRLVALIPTGPSADKRFDTWLESDDAKEFNWTADITLPAVAFERAGTNVMTRIVILDRISDAAERANYGTQTRQASLTGAKDITEFFNRLENLVVPMRPEPKRDVLDELEAETQTADAAPPSVKPGPALTTGLGGFKLAKTVHGKTGDDLFVATIANRVEREVYTALAALAKQHGGWYSNFRGNGAIPGFQFKSEAARAAFLEDAAKPTVSNDPEDAGGFAETAYHGTPHEFDQFSLTAIGTGEGAQAYGWGLYFASRRGIAEHYRRTLSRGFDAKLRGKRIEDQYGWLAVWIKNIGAEFEHGMASFQAVRDEAVSILRSRADRERSNPLGDAKEIREIEEAADILADVTERDISWRGGTLYTVDIPDSDNLLSWDVSLNKQPEAVRERLARVPGVPDPSVWDEWTGEQLYRAMVMDGGELVSKGAIMRADRYASEALRSAGIPGHRYPDAGSRGGTTVTAPDGTDASMYGTGALMEFMAEMPSVRDMDEATIDEVVVELLDFFDGGMMPTYAPALRVLADFEAKGWKVKAHDKSYNYVIYDDTAVRIIEKQQKAQMVREAEASASEILRLMPRLRAELDRLDLKRVKLYFDPLEPDWQGMFQVTGDGDFEVIIGAALDPMKTLHHEVIHIMRQMNLFTPEEWRTLELAAGRGWMERHDIEARYPHLTHEERLEEAIAEEFSWALEKMRPPKGNILVHAFNKIHRLLKAIRNVFQGAGFNTPEDIFGRILSGEISKRQAWNTGYYARMGYNLQAAYHGTPHDFDQFSLDAIGTGEGAQVYGWGLYFAGRKDVAEHYRDTLAGGPLRANIYAAAERYFGGYNSSASRSDVLDFIAAQNGDVGKIKSGLLRLADAMARSSWDSDRSEADGIRALAQDEGYISAVAEARGRLFKVEIPDDNELLDWDAPMSKQSESVRAKLDAADGMLGLATLYPKMTGKGLYDRLSRVEGSPQAASKALRNVGILGHRYLDGGSRNDGDGSRNYVIYDDTAIKILEKRQAKAPRDTATGDLFAQPEEPKRTGMTADQRREMEARQRQSKMRKTGGNSGDAGPLFDDQTDLFGQRRMFQARPLSVRPLTPQGRAHRNTAMGGPLFIPDRRVWDELTRAGVPMWQRVRNGAAAASDAVDRARQVIQDRFLPVLRAQEAIMRATGRPIPADQNAYIAETTFSGKVGRHLLDIDEAYTKPIIEMIAETDGELTVEAVGEWLYARHAIERNAYIASINPTMPDGGSGMTDQDAQDILSLAAAGPHAARLKRIGALIDGLRERTLKLREDAGLISNAEAQLWRTQYKHYVPLKGFAETDHAEAVLDVTGIGKRYSIRGQESRRALGRASEAFNPLQAAITQAQEASIRAEKNRVGQALYELAKGFPSKALWEVKTPAQKRYFNRSTGLVETRVEDPVSLIMDPNEMAVKVDGKEVRIILHDPRLSRAVNTVGADQMNGLLRVMSMFSRFFSMTRTMLNPEFMITNGFRDFQTAQFNIQAFGEADKNRIAKAMAKNWRKAFMGVMRGQGYRFDTEWSRYFNEFQKSGAQVWFWTMEQPEAAKDDIERRVKLQRGGRARRALTWMTTPSAIFSMRDNPALAFIEKTNLAVDNAIRLAAFVEARKAGWPIEQAAFLAKELTVNFNRRGEVGAQMNALYPFFNAAIQGTVRTAKALTSKRVAKMVGVAFVAGVLNDLVNAALSEEDEDEELVYDKIPDYRNERNIHIGWFANSRNPVAIPMPYGYNVFPYAGQQLGKVIRGVKDPGEAFGDVMAAAFGAFSPLNAATPAQFVSPVISDPIVEMAENKNWLGIPIYPQTFGNQSEPDAYVHFRGATEVSKMVAQALNGLTGGDFRQSGAIDVSPETLDHLATFVVGSAGAFWGRTTDFLAKTAQGNFEEIEGRNVPFVRNVFSPVGEWVDRDRFYQFRAEVRDANADAKAYVEAGLPVPAEVAKLAGLYDKLLEVERELNGKGDWNPARANARTPRDAVKVYLDFNREYLRVAGKQGQ